MYVKVHYKSSGKIKVTRLLTSGIECSHMGFIFIVVGSELDFKIGSKTAFNVPLGNVSHTTTGKNEVILEFHQNDDAEVSLMEMRFYIPPSENGEMSLEVMLVA